MTPTSATSNANSHPSGDERYAAIDRTMKRFKYEKDALLEVLNTAQETFGFLSQDLLIYIAEQLKLPLIRVYGVATFYHMFTFEPLGEHNAIVCTGTACHVKGANAIIERVCAEMGVELGQTTADGLFSLTTARCLGSCGLAPVAVLDGKVRAKETPDGMVRHVREMVGRTKDMTAQQEMAATVADRQ